MINPFGKKAKLIREVENLCVLIDKGWGVYDPTAPEIINIEKINMAVNKKISIINTLIKEVGEHNLPNSFIEGVESGSIREDIEGIYYEILKEHLK